jgi:mRNA interferase YafQ
MKLFRTKTFKKDYQIPPEAKDHNLIGNYAGFREYHVGGDILVIYCIEDDIIRLTRIGTHAQLYK